MPSHGYNARLGETMGESSNHQTAGVNKAPLAVDLPHISRGGMAQSVGMPAGGQYVVIATYLAALGPFVCTLAGAGNGAAVSISVVGLAGPTLGTPLAVAPVASELRSAKALSTVLASGIVRHSAEASRVGKAYKTRDLNDSRGDSRTPLVDETAGLRLVYSVLPQRLEFAGDAVARLIQPGLYDNTRALREARRAKLDGRT